MDHTVTYRFGRDDYLALLRAQRQVGAFGGLGRWGRYICFALLLVVLLGLFEFDLWFTDPKIALVSAVLLFVIIVLAAPLGEFLGEHILLLWRFPMLGVANKDCMLRFADDGIYSKYGDIEGRMPWRSITRVLTTKDNIFVAIGRSEMLLAPKRALPSADAVAELERYIRSRISSTAVV